MTEHVQEVYHTLHESTSAWILCLSTLEDDAGRHKSSCLNEATTPELSACLTTISASSPSSTAVGSTVGHVAAAPSSKILKTGTLNQEKAQRRTSTLPSIDASNRARTIFYDSRAQDKLARLVREITLLKYRVRQCSRLQNRGDDILTKLAKTSQLLEDGAFQLLRSGQCRRHTENATALLESLLETSRGELMRKWLVERLGGEQYPDGKVGAASRGMSKVQLEALEVDQDEEETENALPPIRLTSRLVR